MERIERAPMRVLQKPLTKHMQALSKRLDQAVDYLNEPQQGE